jgi:hypothetical protein
MAKLKVKETKVCREYLNTYFPVKVGNCTYLKTCYYLVWALTSKGWYFFNTKYLNPHHAAKMEARVIGRKLNTEHWSTFV